MSLDIYRSIPQDPKEIAMPYVEGLPRLEFEHTEEDTKVLTEIENISAALGFLGKRYYFEGSRGLAIPADTDEGVVKYTSYFGLACEAQLLTYSRISIGKFVGHGAVRALCLTFNNAITVLPDFHKVPGSDLLHVPVLAIDEISESSR